MLPPGPTRRAGPKETNGVRLVDQDVSADYEIERLLGRKGSMMFSHPGFYCVVAESEGRIVGSNCLDERSAIAGVGPITVEPSPLAKH
jgi:hypothetical protein